MVSTVNLLPVAMLLIVMQAVPPIQRKATNGTTSGSDAIKKKADINQTPSPGTLAIQGQASPPKKAQSTKNPPNTNTQESVRVSELPTVSMRKDWWDRSSIIFTGLLVLIGAIGAGFALRTLLAIERQTVALVEGQRPKIGAEPHGDLTQTLQDINAPRIEMRLLNTGQTVARNLTYETWTELLPLPFKDFGPSADHFESVNPVVLHPQHGPPLVINIAVRITPRQLRELKVSRLTSVSASVSDTLTPSARADA